MRLKISYKIFCFKRTNEILQYFKTGFQTKAQQIIHGYGKIGDSLIPGTFVVNQILLLCNSICVKNRHLRQARKR